MPDQAAKQPQIMTAPGGNISLMSAAQDGQDTKNTFYAAWQKLGSSIFGNNFR